MRLPTAPENWPIDYVGPVMRPGLVQTRNDGGPFVLRSNPLGGIIDAILGFCFPRRYVEDDSTGAYFDLDEGDSSSPAFAAYPVIDFGTFPGRGYGPMGVECGPGTLYDPVVGQCIPKAMAEEMGEMAEPTEACGPEELAMARRTLLDASRRCDSAEIAKIASLSDSCRRLTSGTLKAGWSALYQEASRLARTMQERCARVAMRANAAVAAHPMGARMMMDSATRLPNVISTGTLTEGNAGMRASAEPMGGTVDVDLMPEAPRATRRRPGFGYR